MITEIKITPVVIRDPEIPENQVYTVTSMIEGVPKSREKTRWFYMNGSPKRMTDTGGRADFRTFEYDRAARKIRIQIIYMKNEVPDLESSMEWQYILEANQECVVVNEPIFGGGTSSLSRNAKTPHTLDVKSHTRIEVFLGNSTIKPSVRFVSNSAKREYALVFASVKN